ncbi:sulfite exporter TauE/SafE family protein [Thermus sp. FJN-A]
MRARSLLPWLALAGLWALLLALGPWLTQVVGVLYGLASKPFALLAGPLDGLRRNLGLPEVGALFLGLLGALAPCQLSTNAAALAWLARPTPGGFWSRFGAFLLGKALVYSLLGALALLGLAASGGFLAWVRKALGPLMLLLGLHLLGLLHLPAPGWGLARLGRWAEDRGGHLGAFALGVAFGLAFCPTLFWLFFGLLLPTAATSALGLLFPTLFALGTGVPVLLLLALFRRGHDRGPTLRGLKRLGSSSGRLAGLVFLLAGLYDTVVYWFL